jgi:hypothetical protein
MIRPPGSIIRMAMITSGTVRTALAMNRFRMYAYSGFSSSSILTVRGSRAMPHLGQLPGSSRMISGCMGQKFISMGVKKVTGQKGIDLSADDTD